LREASTTIMAYLGPVSLQKNGFRELLNSRFRDEPLNTGLFTADT